MGATGRGTWKRFGEIYNVSEVRLTPSGRNEARNRPSENSRKKVSNCSKRCELAVLASQHKTGRDAPDVLLLLLAPPSVELSRCRAWLACPGFKTGLERAWCFRLSRCAPDCASPDLSRLRPKKGCGGSLSGIYHHSVADAGLHGAARIKVGYLGHFVAVRSGSALASGCGRLLPPKGCGGSPSGIYNHSVAGAGLDGAARMRVGYLGRFLAVCSGSSSTRASILGLQQSGACRPFVELDGTPAPLVFPTSTPIRTSYGTVCARFGDCCSPPLPLVVSPAHAFPLSPPGAAGAKPF